MWKSAKFPLLSMVFGVSGILKTVIKLSEKVLTDCGKVFLGENFWVFKVINMTFQYEIYVEKSYFWGEHKFSIEFSTWVLKTFFNIIFSLCIKHFWVYMLIHSVVLVKVFNKFFVCLETCLKPVEMLYFF